MLLTIFPQDFQLAYAIDSLQALEGRQVLRHHLTGQEHEPPEHHPSL